MTYAEALEKMFDRNYFGMMMVENGDADTFIAGTYSSTESAREIAKEVIGIRPGFNHFATMHIINTKRGVYFLADTTVNSVTDEETLLDIARLTRYAVKYFAHEPVMAMISHSNFGSRKEPECRAAHNVVERMHKLYPDLAIDGEMQVHNALNREIRDANYPFSRLNGKEVNTLIFPNLAAANTAYRMMLEMGVGDAIGPIQMGLNKPVHFINVDSPVRDILNLTAMSVLDAAVLQTHGKPSDE